MECDIHLTAEYRDAKGTWHNDDLTDAADKYGDQGPRHKEENYDLRLYSGRSYDLFAILANVRNGYGFAGVTTGEGFNPIADPRGVPFDAADITKRYMQSYESDGHSHSYFTVAELMAYDWTQVTHKTGIVGYHGLARFKLYGKLENWSGGISGPGIVEHDGAQAVEIVNKLTADEPAHKWWDVYHGFGVWARRTMCASVSFSTTRRSHQNADHRNQ
jgi:hypothetical protein